MSFHKSGNILNAFPSSKVFWSIASKFAGCWKYWKIFSSDFSRRLNRDWFIFMNCFQFLVVCFELHNFSERKSVKGENDERKQFFSILLSQHKKKKERNRQTPYGAIELLLVFSVNIAWNHMWNLRPDSKKASTETESSFRPFRSSLAHALCYGSKLLTTNNDSMHWQQLLQFSLNTRRLSPHFRMLFAFMKLLKPNAD